MQRYALALGLLVGLATAAPAQSVSCPPGHGNAIGLTIDQYYAGRARAYGVSFRGMGPARTGVASTLGAGLLRDQSNGSYRVAAFDLGVGHLARVGSTAFLVEAGATGLFGAYAGALGGYAGTTLLVPVAGTVAVRIGASRRAYLAGGVPGLWLISVGITTLPRQVPGPANESVAQLRGGTE